MNTTNRYLIDLDVLSAVEGNIHIYAVDLNNILFFMNAPHRSFFQSILKKDPLGLTLHELFEDNEEAAEYFTKENKLVSDTQKAHLFYNRMHQAHSTWLDLITIKIPIYHVNNTLAGVLGISHYVEKRTALPAHEMGLTKREIECIYLLLDGNTYKEIAKKMNISSRTVESYIVNVKNKLACESSHDLFNKLNKAQLKTDIKEMFNMSSTNLSVNTNEKRKKRARKKKK